MAFKPPPLVSRIYKLKIIGDLIAFVFYIFWSLSTPLTMRLAGYRKIKLGTSVIWTPTNKRQTILDGIECLRSHDAEMYFRLTKKQKLVFYYSRDENMTNLFGRFFGLREVYIRDGAEGVAYFLVQSLIVSDAHPSLNQHRKNEFTRNSLRAVARKTMEWMQQHSFDPRLINDYSKVVEYWEQKHPPVRSQG